MKKSDEELRNEFYQMQDKIPLNTFFIHKKSGNEYQTVFYCFLEHNAKPAICYVNNNQGIPWVRDSEEFLEKFEIKQGE